MSEELFARHDGVFRAVCVHFNTATKEGISDLVAVG
jgi:hypothetical protein